MRHARLAALLFPVSMLCAAVIDAPGQTTWTTDGMDVTPEIREIDPPEKGFFTKVLDDNGIPIKAPAVVSNDALYEARNRIDRELKHLRNVRYNLSEAGAELHIIGKFQGTSDLPEWVHMKGKPFEGKLTIDERTRGMGGLMTSCGEENLLNLPVDRYHGRDICTHEFAHCIQDYGLSDAVRRMITAQYKKSTEAGLWRGAYAATNESEFFAELTMWYFGTHGDMNMEGVKPASGRIGLKAYDPGAYKLLDDLYSGRIKVSRLKASHQAASAPPPPAPGSHSSPYHACPIYRRPCSLPVG